MSYICIEGKRVKSAQKQLIINCHIVLLFMSDTKTFDLIVIGTGVAASTVAWKCRSAGWSVAIVDSRPFGGTCALRGCDPKEGTCRRSRSNRLE